MQTIKYKFLMMVTLLVCLGMTFGCSSTAYKQTDHEVAVSSPITDRNSRELAPGSDTNVDSYVAGGVIKRDARSIAAAEPSNSETILTTPSSADLGASSSGMGR